MEYVLIGVILLVGTLCQGTIGFGLGTIATPLIALFRPDLVPTIILALAFVIASTTLFQERRTVSWDVVGLTSVARLPGSALGAWAISALSHRGLSLFIGFAVLAAMTLSTLGWSPRRSTPNLVTAGVASGFLGTATSIGGPPMALVMKGFDPSRVRGTMSATFVIGSIISMAVLVAGEQATQHQFLTAAAFLPVVLAGLVAARVLNRHIDAARLNRLVAVVAIGAALALILQAAFS